jgi:hypothetical protein
MIIASGATELTCDRKPYAVAVGMDPVCRPAP